MITIYPDLKDKVVLVTGATRGIGKAIALNLAQQGAEIVFNYRGEKNKADDLTEQLQSFGIKSHALNFDLSDGQKINQELTRFVKEVAPITGVVNNAGISKDQLIMKLKEQELSEIIDINLKGPILVTAALSRSFLRAKDVSVVNISSIAGLMGNVGQSAYSASKAGLIGFTKSFAKELGSRNVRCNAVCPGFIDTDMTKELDGSVREGYEKHIPLRKLGSADDVANLVIFLLSQSSSYITGEVIKIDGGLYI